MAQQPELLNLDELSDLDRGVEIKGKRYRIADRSLKDTIEAIKRSERLEKKMKNNSNPVQMLEAMKEMVSLILPDCPEEVISSLTQRQIKALIDFANASDMEVAEGAEADAEGKS